MEIGSRKTTKRWVYGCICRPFNGTVKRLQFTDVTDIENKKESVLQSFISGLEDAYIRQWILEKDVDLEDALESAEILKRAKTDVDCYET